MRCTILSIMTIETLFKQVPEETLKIPQKYAYQGTRFDIHYGMLRKFSGELKEPYFSVLVGLLRYGEDPFYMDVLDYASTCKLWGVYDYFKKYSDSKVLKSFMDDIEELDEEFFGESEIDTDASNKIGVQSTIAPTMVEEMKTLKVGDPSEMPVLDMTSMPDKTRENEDHESLASLGCFLERPLLIGTFRWTPSSDFDNVNNFVDIPIWKDYLGSNGISRKVNNYRLFRARGMRLQFRINGSPFHYGRLYAGYSPGPFNSLPYPGMQIPQSVVTTATNILLPNQPLKTHYSQWPGVFIDPCTNMPQTMDVPFMWNMNYCSMVSDTDTTNLGYLKIWVLTPLLHANGSTDPITLTVTAHMIDPVLSVPTDFNAFSGESGMAGSGTQASKPGRTRKSKKASSDEYGKTAVSAGATAVANFAGSLADVPFIGPYATATQVAASGISKIAALFGFSKPIIINDPNPVQMKGNGSLATSEGGDSSQKVTLDPKQEITIDPVVTGLQPVDEMSFAHLFKRESLLVQVPWTTADTAKTDLVHIAVGPWNRPIDAGDGIEYNTALSWASQPFQYWRGSLKYRFQFVASQMHRGRVAIVYNPNTSSGSDVLPEQTKTHQYFLDLSEARDITIVVRYAHPNPWLLNDPVPVTFITNSAIEFNVAVRPRMNGVLSMYVLNELAAPSNTADIQCNVFISAGDDFQVAGPGHGIARLSPYAANIETFYGESMEFFGESMVADYKADNEMMPVSTLAVTLNGAEDATPDVDEVLSVHFGEQVVSLRAFLKRYTYYTTWFPFQQTPVGVAKYTSVHGPTPLYRGDVTADGNGSIGQGTLTNFCYTTLLNWYMPGFLAYRGSIRWKHNMIAGNSLHTTSSLRIVRGTLPADAADRYKRTIINGCTGASTDPEIDRITAWINTTGAAPIDNTSGVALQYVRMGNTLEYEHPFYCPLRFMFHKGPTPNITDSNNPFEVQSYQAAFEVRNYATVDLFMNSNQSGGANNAIDMYCAAGEDFSLHYFIGAPVMGFS